MASIMMENVEQHWNQSKPPEREAISRYWQPFGECPMLASLNSQGGLSGEYRYLLCSKFNASYEDIESWHQKWFKSRK